VKKFALVLSAIVAGFLGAVVVPGMAQAALPCPSYNICTFQDEWLNSGQYDFYGPGWIGCHFVGSGLNDKIKAVRQGPSLQGVISWYVDSNCSGPAWGGLIATTGHGINDQIRSCNNYSTWTPWNINNSACYGAGGSNGSKLSSFYYSG
jgi:hypothetical protein